MKKRGSGTFYTASPVYINAFHAVVGEKEKKGPLGTYFDTYSYDEYFGMDTFEKAETYMQKEAIENVIKESGLSEKNIDFVFAGDLLNQCAGSNYSVRGFDLQFFGLYGACSTMAEALTLATICIDGGFASNVLTLTSSHFCSAERQYRFPLEYGSQRTPTAQWTVTGAGCVLLGSDGCENTPKIKAFTPGIITDFGVTDINNMGSAMAPAAAATLKRYFADSCTGPDDYDLIASGDLGSVGHSLVIELLGKEGITLKKNYVDCGMMIFDAETQDVHAGGSGCGCSASVLTGYILPMMKKKIYKNVLFMATGALMSPTSNLQGESIPGIAHLVNITV